MRTGQNGRLRSDNKGFSLVEMMVILAILAVLGTGIAYSLGLVSGARNKECITQLNTAIGNTRISTMGRKDTYMLIYCGSDGVYVKQVESGTESEKKIGSESLSVTYQDSAGTDYPLPDSSSPLCLYFDRSSGAVDVAASSDFVSITSGVYTVELIRETGKSSVVRN